MTSPHATESSVLSDTGQLLEEAQGGARGLRPYPEYRDSGVEWIGEIPDAWDLKRLKNVTRCLDGKRVPLNAEQRGEMQGDYPYWGANGVLDSVDDWLFDEPLVLLGEDGAPFFEPHKDVAFGVNGKLWVNNHAHVLRPTGIVQGFLAYALNTVNYSAYIEGTTRDKLVQGKMKEIPVPSPPLPEQQAIAAFLDRETTRIDELIAKKQRLIELLAEKRAALISHAVTKGLNPDAPMKNSCIEWLGEVPAHWSLAPLYARYWLELGKMLDAKRITGDHLVPYLRNVDVQWDRVNVEDLPEMDISPLEYDRFILSPGELLVCEGGEVGRSAIWKGELSLCAYQKALHRLRPRSPREHVRFLYYALRHAASTNIFLAQGNPNTIPHLTGEQLRVYRFPFPPSDEQDEICTFLDQRLEQLDSMDARIAEGIEALREYRSALISAAVTGKIDIRELDA